MVAVVLGAVGFFVQALYVLGEGCEVVWGRGHGLQKNPSALKHEKHHSFASLTGAFSHFAAAFLVFVISD